MRKVTKKEKLIEKVRQGKRISSDEASKFLNLLGYQIRKQSSGTSHTTYSNGKRIITIVLDEKELKTHYIEKLQEILRAEGV